MDLGRCERPVPEAEVAHLALKQRINRVVALAEVAIRSVGHVWNKSLARAGGDFSTVHIDLGHTRAGDRDTEMLPRIGLDRPGCVERLHRSVLPDLQPKIVRGGIPSQDNILATTSRVADVKVSGEVAHCRCIRPEAGAEAICEISDPSAGCSETRVHKSRTAVEPLRVDECFVENLSRGCGVGKRRGGRDVGRDRLGNETQGIIVGEVGFAAAQYGIGCRLHLRRCQRRLPEAEVAHLALEQRIIGMVALAEEAARAIDRAWDKSWARARGD